MFKVLYFLDFIPNIFPIYSLVHPTRLALVEAVCMVLEIITISGLVGPSFFTYGLSIY